MNALTFTTAVNSAKTAYNIAKGLLDITKDFTFRDKIIELQNIIFTLQNNITVLGENHSNLVHIKEKIERDLDKYINWNIEKDKYIPQKLETGTIIYIIKEPQNSVEKEMWFCPNCYKNSQASILQPGDYKAQGQMFFCPNHECHNSYLCKKSKDRIKIVSQPQPRMFDKRNLNGF